MWGDYKLEKLIPMHPERNNPETTPHHLPGRGTSLAEPQMCGKMTEQ